MDRPDLVRFARSPRRRHGVDKIWLFVGSLLAAALCVFAFIVWTGGPSSSPDGENPAAAVVNDSSDAVEHVGVDASHDPDVQGVGVAAEAPELYGDVYTRKSVNLRESPSLESPSLRMLEKDAWLKVIGRGSKPEVVDGLTSHWYRVAMSPCVSGWVFGAYLNQGQVGQRAISDEAEGKISPFFGREEPVDTEALTRLFKEEGYVPDPSFKVYVVAYERIADGTIRPWRFDHRGTSIDRENWWPASTVKLFAAVAALESLRAMGFSTKAEVTFHYANGDVTNKVKWLVDQAVTPSNNTAFDRLGEIVGFEKMRRWFVDRGLPDTVLLRAYSGRVRDKETNLGTPRESPALTITEGRKTIKVPARVGNDKPWECPKQGNCTTLQDLSEVLRRVMLHEELPQAMRFKLGDTEIDVLRRALSGKRSRGLGVVNGLREGFGSKTIECYNKPGFACNWFSDHVFVRCPDCPGPVKEWMVAMAGLGGRDVCDEGARVVGRLIASGRLMNEHMGRRSIQTSHGPLDNHEVDSVGVPSKELPESPIQGGGAK